MNSAKPPPSTADATATAAVSVLHVEGMTCNNCARHVTEAAQAVPGVQSVMVNLEAARATVRWLAGAPPELAQVIATLTAAGFPARDLSTPESQATHKTTNHWQLNLWLGGGVTAILMLGEWVLQLAMQSWFQWTAFALASVVQLVCGAQFYRGAWRQLKAGNANMDTLVALGSTTAFTYSAWALLSGAGGHVYFMEAASIITLISIGHWVEARVGARASSALQALLELAPQTARRLGATKPAPVKLGAGFNLLSSKFSASSAPPPETEVPVADLRVGDLIALRPGDRVPVDGVVTEGDSAVDESMLTGESKPVDKARTAELYAGTVNLNGRLILRVTKTGEATALAHIIAAVQRAQTSRANIQRLGDRVSNVFVPIVVTLALVAGLWWGFAPASAQRAHDALASFLWSAHPPMGLAAGFIIAAAILIVACPCAMGLATPAAIMASANAASRLGILIRDGVALEKAGHLTAIVFDKTGTLTEGRPEVAAVAFPNVITQKLEIIVPAAASQPNPVAALAAALARSSTHPLSQAIARLAVAQIKLADWREIRGAGIEAKTPAGEIARLGSLRWLRESGIDFQNAEAFVADWSGRGATVVGLATGTSLAGLYAIQDAVKLRSHSVVDQLTRSGLKVFLLTGDNRGTALSVAQQVAIAPDRVLAEVKPEEKATFIQKLQAQGERVAFVGDGINDAPALTQADLGIAVSRASDVAREAADIILLKSDIEAVPQALGLARATLRTIKQNLFWAFFYNAVGIPLAALGFMSPVLCAAAMGFSDLIVIGNALRLRSWKLK